MEETLGKRIVAHRKRLGLTQDALAEVLGVTAQAISKWENDQSCPDIAMLPKLAEVFETSTDELLGLEKKEIHLAEVVPKESENEAQPPKDLPMDSNDHTFEFQWDSGKKGNNSHTFEFQWDSGRKGNIGLAVWVLLVGLLLLGMYFEYPRPMYFTLWELLWTSALFIFGVFGLFPKFSFFRFGCAFFGGYFLLETGGLLKGSMHEGLMIAIIVLLFGLGLLFEALRKPKKGNFPMNHIGSSNNHCTYNGECFDCATAFGDNNYLIQLPRLSGGCGEVSFGEMTVDLSGCEEFADNCRLELKCSFGELELLVPRCCRVDPASSTAFASVETKGAPDSNAAAVISLDCSVSFGEITIRYI